MCVGECGFLNHFTDRHEHMKSQHVPGCVLIYSDSDSVRIQAQESLHDKPTVSLPRHAIRPGNYQRVD